MAQAQESPRSPLMPFETEISLAADIGGGWGPVLILSVSDQQPRQQQTLRR